MLEVRFVEASRTAGRELGVQWNVVGNRAFCKSAIASPRTTCRSARPRSRAGSAGRRRSPAPSPFGFVIGRDCVGKRRHDRRADQCARAEGHGPHASPSRTWSRCPATPRASSPAANFRSRCPARSAGHDRVQEIRRRPRLHADRARRRPDQPEDRAGGQPARHRPYDPVSDGISVPALIVRRASTTVELRDGQSFVIGGLLQSNSRTRSEQLPWLGDVPVLGALFSQRVLPEERDRPRHHRHAAPGASGAARRRDQDAARQHAAAERRRFLPDGQDARSRVNRRAS